MLRTSCAGIARPLIPPSKVRPQGGGTQDTSDEMPFAAIVRETHLIWLGKPPVVARIVERLVPDELWELFQRVVPEAPSRPQGGGRRRHGDREVLAAIIFVATSGCTWQQLPTASFGPSGATAHRRSTEWTKARVWAELHRLVLDEAGSRGELDWSRCAIDSVNMRALKRGS
ncbi:transposase [Streptomyces spiralis]